MSKELASSGPICVEWMAQYLASPMGTGDPFTPTKAQADFVNAVLTFDPKTGERYASTAVLSLPKGSGKSPFGSAFLLAWCLAPIHPHKGGEGITFRSLWDTKVPHGVIAASTETQAKNAFGSFPAVCTPALEETYGVVVRKDKVGFSGGGGISLMTNSARSAEGHPTDVAFIDQTESFESAGLLRFYGAVCRNVAKNGGLVIEAPNAPQVFAVGEAANYNSARSVSERSLTRYRTSLRSGRSPLLDDGLVYHSDFYHGNIDDLKSHDDVVAALKEAYKGSLEPNGFKTEAELGRLARTFFTEDDRSTWARYFLNIPGAVSNAWLASDQLTAVVKSLPDIGEDDVFAIGFDGARGQSMQSSNNVPDHTVITLAAKRSGDPEAPTRFYLHRVWKRPDGEKGKWAPPRGEVIDEIHKLIRDGINGAQCVGCFGDSSYWEGDFAFLEQQQAVKRLKVSASRKHKVAVVNQDPRSRQMPEVYEKVYDDITTGSVYINDDGELPSYFAACVRKLIPSGYLLYKTSKYGEKIDAAIACCLAYAAISDYEGTGAVVNRARGIQKCRRKVAVI